MESVAGENSLRQGPGLHEESAGTYTATETAMMKRSNKAKIVSELPRSKLHKAPKPTAKAFREQSCAELEQRGLSENESKSTITRDAAHLQGKDNNTSMGIMKMIGMIKPSKRERRDGKEANENRHRKMKMLFPYDEFVKLFHSECFWMSPGVL